MATKIQATYYEEGKGSFSVYLPYRKVMKLMRFIHRNNVGQHHDE